jgi:ABC-type transport system involved in multi-copper enzyme maturation permease subunit
MNIRSHSISYFLSLTWLTGAIFDKELRVSSRRKRNYALRFFYVVLLTVFVATTWMSIGEVNGSLAYQKTRMALAGKTIVTTIVTFQFIVAHLIAVIMLSNSISDEVYHRTLGVLMTTPINAFQIVTGKLFSKLLQIILLIAVSVPLLAVVRVFGGVPWGYIISSLCITLTATIFAGALSLYFSISNRHAYVVIIKTVFTLGVLFLFLPLLIGAVFHSQWFYTSTFDPDRFPELKFIIYCNPYGAFSLNTIEMLSPSVGFSFFWLVHCAIMLVLSSFLVARSIQVVRKVALRQITGAGEFSSKKQYKKITTNQACQGQEYMGTVREVNSSPVLWKEIRAPLIQGGEGKNSRIGLLITISVLLLTYIINFRQGVLFEDFTHITYTLMFVIVISIFTMIFASTSVTSEKESGAWPILITTSLSDWQIIYDKALGVFYRCIPVLLLLECHIIIFTIVGTIHPIVILHLAMILTGMLVFLVGLGLFCSLRFRRTTSAVITNLIWIGFFWAVIPVGVTIVHELWRPVFLARTGVYIKYVASIQPLYQVSVIMSAAAGRDKAPSSLFDLNYNWAIGDVVSTTYFLLVIMIINIWLGLLFAWAGKRWLRRNIF